MLKKLFAFLLGCVISTMAASQNGQQEASLKAVFVYNFTRYIDWSTYTGDDDNFIIGVIGSTPVANSLAEIAKNSTAQGKAIVVKQYAKLSDIGKCHILYIPKDVTFSIQAILNTIGKGVLTVSEQTGYAKDGTAFNFVIKNDKLKFEANLQAIEDAGLKASSQLLKLAIIVN